MATVNQNMFGASITEQPRGAQLMVLPLNLLVEIVSHVGIAHRFPLSPNSSTGERHWRPRPTMPNMSRVKLHGAPAAIQQPDADILRQNPLPRRTARRHRERKSLHDGSERNNHSILCTASSLNDITRRMEGT